MNNETEPTIAGLISELRQGKVSQSPETYGLGKALAATLIEAAQAGGREGLDKAIATLKRQGNIPPEVFDGRTEPKIFTDIRKVLGIAGIGELSMNELSMDMEANIEGKRMALGEGELAKLRTWAREYGFKGMEAFNDALIALAHSQKSNAIRELFEGLPKWDGKDHIKHLASYLKTTNDPTIEDGTTRTLSHAYLRRWLIGVPGKALYGKQAVMLVLAGKQGMGKTSLVRWLVPDILFQDTKLDLGNKDSDIALTRKLVWEVGELNGWKGASQEALKAFITRKTVSQRLPYGRRATDMPARCSLVGTTNDGSFLSDTTGNRRYMVIDLENINWAYQREVSLPQVLAQALYLAQQGEQAIPTGEETQAQAQHNTLYAIEDGVSDIVRSYIAFTGNPNDALTTGQLMLHINGREGQSIITDKAIKGRVIAKALKEAGAITVKTRNGTVYTQVALLDNPVWGKGTIELAQAPSPTTSGEAPSPRRWGKGEAFNQEEALLRSRLAKASGQPLATFYGWDIEQMEAQLREYEC